MRNLLTAFLLASLAACGGTAANTPGSGGGSGSGGIGGDAGAGGSGGGGGDGGMGGTGGKSIEPEIDSIDPTHAPPGAEVTFRGLDLDLASGVGFTDAGAEILDIQGKIALRTIVPASAVTGPVFVTSGAKQIPGPTFTVDPVHLVPALLSIDPAVVIVGQPASLLTAYGVGLQGGTILVDGVELLTVPVGDALQARIPASLGAAVGMHQVVVTTPGPTGDTSQPLVLEIAPALHVTGAGFQALDSLIIRFDTPLSPDFVQSVRLSIDPMLQLGPPALADDSPRALKVPVKGIVVADTISVSVSGDLRGANDSRLVPATVRLRAFDALPLPIETRFLPQDCTATGLIDPSGMSASATHLYITERQGNQVQVLTPAGLPEYFLGNIVEGFPGAYTDGTAAGCPGRRPQADGGLFLPVGAALELPSGHVIVGDVDSLKEFYPGGGVQPYPFKNPVALLESDGDVYVAAEDMNGNSALFRLSFTQSSGSPLYKIQTVAAHGTGDLQFEFDLAGGGRPSASHGPDAYAATRVAYVAEPGNHRVQRLVNFNSSAGWVGAGPLHTGKGFLPGGMCCSSGTEPGEFLRPRGVTALPGGTLLVIDEANGGRLQKLDASGLPLAAENLGFMPAGMTLGPDGTLFIVETDGPLHRYVP